MVFKTSLLRLFSAIMCFPEISRCFSDEKRVHVRSRRILEGLLHVLRTQRLWTSHLLVVFLTDYEVVARIGGYFHCNYCAEFSR